MDKIGLFILLVFVGVGSMLLISNHKNPVSQTPSITPIPTLPQLPTSTPMASLSANTTPSATINTKEAIIQTNKGDIVLELYSQDAPNTVKNFITKAENGFYNNLTFHRVEDWVIQGGDPKGNGTGGGSMPTELNSKPFVIGSLGVARGGDIKVSNDAQFFITKTDASWLNNQYTNFGFVTKGMDVVSKIQIGDKILG